LVGLASIAIDRDDLPAALEWYKKMLKANPKSAEPAFKAANILWRNKDYDGAIGFYRQALEIKPDYTEARFGLGVALKDKGDTEAALVELRKACKDGIKPACGHVYKLEHP
jgi:tetratricopeptide (TPR) repeat protein